MCVLVSGREGGRERKEGRMFCVASQSLGSRWLTVKYRLSLSFFTRQPCVLPPLLALSNYWLWWWLQIGRDSISSWISASSPCGSLDGGKVQICCYFLSFISRAYQPAFSSACLASVVQGLGSGCAVAALNIFSLHTAPLFLFFSAFSNITWTPTFLFSIYSVPWENANSKWTSSFLGQINSQTYS